MRSFNSLSEREVLALAIQNEEEDGRIYGDLADGVREQFPGTAAKLDMMREEENVHRRRLLELFQQRFGNHVPLIRREDVKGFVKRRAVWLMRPLGIETIRHTAASMEAETRQFYDRAAARTSDADLRKLLGDLSNEERNHENMAGRMEADQQKTGQAEEENRVQRRLFVLQVVQPGLAGLMDGSVSTLAPLFAAAVATHSSWDAFAVGLAASVGAGISMGFAEALSDDGSLTGRGHPWLRGVVCGLMTTAGGIGHTFPFLIPKYGLAMTIAMIVVSIELAAIAWIRKKYMDTPLLAAMFQVVLGGILVFIAGMVIGYLVPGSAG